MTNAELSNVFSETARELYDAWNNGSMAGQIDLTDIIEILDIIAEKIAATEQSPCN